MIEVREKKLCNCLSKPKDPDYKQYKLFIYFNFGNFTNNWWRWKPLSNTRLGWKALLNYSCSNLAYLQVIATIAIKHNCKKINFLFPYHRLYILVIIFCALLCIPIGMSKKLSKKFQIVMLNVMIFIHFPFSSSFSSKYFLICGYLFLVFFEIKENDIINNWKTAEIYKTYTIHPETFFLFYSFVLHKNNISYQSPALKLGFSQDLINYFRLLL